ncbi:hydroxymethylglutaryl-CoA reductase, degradative [Alloscardovia venturai]|uniref:3-hydroxy-3-methylglutaryl coenzyme A reductase n=1 Tax=Alloscardovia venturai TaxID=1769421 RepID=A0ABW2Y4J7_9BIFI
MVESDESKKRKFYRLSPLGRLEVLSASGVLSDVDISVLAQANECGILSPDAASHLIENQISQYALPMGVVRGLRVNGRDYTVPMVVEEASVVAAASHGAHMSAVCGGVVAHTQESRVRGEVVYAAHDVSYDKLKQVVVSCEAELRAIARKALPSMHARGGGLEALFVEKTPDNRFVKTVLVVNPCDAMGANAVNTIAEAISHTLESPEYFGIKPLVAILSNAGNDSVTTAHVELTPQAVAFRGASRVESEKLVKRIALLSDLAVSDYDRAVTHNKGIMNGISSAVLASGNDTRAVESCAHAYAGRGQSYMPLTRWYVNDAGNLCGHIEVPLQVGIVGGAASSIPLAGVARRMGHYENVAEFKNVLAALGLVQNLSALRALAGPGIQAGHMNLQMNALAIAAGAQGDDIDVVASLLRKLKPAERTSARAAQFVEQINSKRQMETEHKHRENQGEGN